VFLDAVIAGCAGPDFSAAGFIADIDVDADVDAGVGLGVDAVGFFVGGVFVSGVSGTKSSEAVRGAFPPFAGCPIKILINNLKKMSLRKIKILYFFLYFFKIFFFVYRRK